MSSPYDPTNPENQENTENSANTNNNNVDSVSTSNPGKADANQGAPYQGANQQGGFQQGGFQQNPVPPASRKLYRSVNDRMISGVCGGIAETYGIDPVLVRVLFVAAFLLGFSGGLIYLICWIVIPDQRY
ncbi:MULTISPECIES: PspC domain-containing protein [unclassified Corynebacterium]|uniref:PspC domain-containing protein n=1 Tax=unclassified Corynebacterium TaxID=2624378 RepID=UPI002882E3C4|nr:MULTISPECIES: PspC domain-containing protein [unclassified Corynebacterium]